MDLKRLRNLLHNVLVDPRHTRGEDLDDFCAAHGLSKPVTGSSKRERLASAMAETSDSDMAVVGERVLSGAVLGVDRETRTKIQDILWQDCVVPALSKKVRREIARAIDAVPLYLHLNGFDRLLQSLWPVEPSEWAFLTGGDGNELHKQIERHVYSNDDWDCEKLFEELGALDAPDPRFVLFLQELASGDVRPDVDAQRAFAAAVNTVLVLNGAELREVDERDGYPAFRIVSTHQGVQGRPKNIIFASSAKPDIRFKDAINNDIEIATNADKVLIYDRPIGAGGLTWNDLQAWWADSKSITDAKQAKKSLYRRLKQCIPSTSPPQMMLFESYFKTFTKAIPQLPALLPEVWLHWDHKTVQERGPDALLRFRMDFLMLLPAGVRIVIEVDGKHHYESPTAYARMMEGDRELKLAGYEVFRFGTVDLSSDVLESVGGFFRQLLARYRVVI